MKIDSVTGINTPDAPSSASTDTMADLTNAIIANANILANMFKQNGSFNTTQSDSLEGYDIARNGRITAWGYAEAPVKMIIDKVQVSGTIVFKTPFPHVCEKVTGSDAGGYGMAFGFDHYTKTGCKWHTCIGLGEAGHMYAPNYQAIGW